MAKHVPPSIEQGLSGSETIICSLNEDRNLDWFVTTKRVLKYRKLVFGEQISELPLRSISSVVLRTQPHWGTFLVGAVLSAGSLALLLLEDSPLPPDQRPLSFLVALFGGALALIGLIWKRTFYELISPGVKREDWRLNLSGKTARNFVDELRRHLP